MVFERDKNIMFEEDLAWIDCRMIAFKHEMMNSRLLYWDIVNSKQIEPEERKQIQLLLIEYMHKVERKYMRDVMDFELPDYAKEKRDFYRHESWCIHGDAIILGLTPHAEPEKIVYDLKHDVLGKQDARSTIGYYTEYSPLVLPDYEMYTLDFPYFKAQMEIGKLNDSRPTKEQVDEYYEKNHKHVMKMELVNERSINRK